MKKIKVNTFTERQLQILKVIKPGYPVNDIRLLRKLAKIGVITLHAQTGMTVRHVWGHLVRAFYLDDAEIFEVENIGIFHRKFVSGCFCPYLIRAELDDRGRVKY